MMKVRIVQLLCPLRHCFIALAYDSPDGEPIPEMEVKLREGFDRMVQKGAKPSCGICDSKKLHAEDSATRFETMEEARPFLQEAERRQAATRQYLRASRG